MKDKENTIRENILNAVSDFFNPTIEDGSLQVEIEVKADENSTLIDTYWVDVSAYYRELLDATGDKDRHTLLAYRRFKVFQEDLLNFEDVKQEIIKHIAQHAIWTATRNLQDVNILREEYRQLPKLNG